MDAAELDALLQDVRDYMVMVRGGDKPFIDALTDIARENKPAAKGIGHIIEQHLLKVRPVAESFVLSEILLAPAWSQLLLFSQTTNRAA
jgi:hypothetical protein